MLQHLCVGYQYFTGNPEGPVLERRSPQVHADVTQKVLFMQTILTCDCMSRSCGAVGGGE